ncbi:hypothetical protein COCNU_scaffold061990G000010 [Cocos nucifera]|nr:hypothetical protein [Cocos nucifera]
MARLSSSLGRNVADGGGIDSGSGARQHACMRVAATNQRRRLVERKCRRVCSGRWLGRQLEQGRSVRFSLSGEMACGLRLDSVAVVRDGTAEAWEPTMEHRSGGGDSQIRWWCVDLSQWWWRANIRRWMRPDPVAVARAEVGRQHPTVVSGPVLVLDRRREEPKEGKA